MSDLAKEAFDKAVEHDFVITNIRAQEIVEKAESEMAGKKI